MAALFVAKNTGFTLIGVGTTVTFTIDVGSAADRFVKVFGAVYTTSQPTTVNSATLNGVVMTPGTQFIDAQGRRNRLFTIKPAATGVLTCVITFGDNNSTIVGMGESFSGVDQTAPFSGEVSDTGGNGLPSLIVSSASGDLVSMSGYSPDTGITMSPTSPATETMDDDISGTRGFGLVSAGAASVTIAGSLGASIRWAAAAISIKSATPPVTLSGAAPLDDLGASGTFVTSVGTFTSEVLYSNIGGSIGIAADQSVNFICLYDSTTGALVVRKTGLSVVSGIVSFSDPAIVAGTFYRPDLELADGTRIMPLKAAT